MPFNRKPQKFNAQIKAVEIGVGEKAIKIGGENILPFYTFDGDMGNTPKVGVEISDMGLEGAVPGIVSYYEGCTTVAELAKKAAEMEDNAERDVLIGMIADQMRKDLFYWNKDALNDDKIADDITNFTDGKIRIGNGKFRLSESSANARALKTLATDRKNK